MTLVALLPPPRPARDEKPALPDPRPRPLPRPRPRNMFVQRCCMAFVKTRHIIQVDHEADRVAWQRASRLTGMTLPRPVGGWGLSVPIFDFLPLSTAERLSTASETVTSSTPGSKPSNGAFLMAAPEPSTFPCPGTYLRGMHLDALVHVSDSCRFLLLTHQCRLEGDVGEDVQRNGRYHGC